MERRRREIKLDQIMAHHFLDELFVVNVPCKPNNKPSHTKVGLLCLLGRSGLGAARSKNTRLQQISGQGEIIAHEGTSHSSNY